MSQCAERRRPDAAARDLQYPRILPVEPIRVVTTTADAFFRPAGPAHWRQLDPTFDERDGLVASWPRFHAATAGRALFARLGDYPAALLIAGCDRPATTAITRMFKRVPCFAGSDWGHDDELEGALLLAGLREPQHSERHCFQTSYVGARYAEYFAHADFRLIWLVREPRAAVFSLLGERQRARPTSAEPADDQPTSTGGSRLEQACATYIATVRQTLELKQRLGKRIAVIDYDALIADRARLLRALCRFAAVEYDQRLLGHLHGKSTRRGILASWEAAIVDSRALPAYRRALEAAQNF